MKDEGLKVFTADEANSMIPELTGRLKELRVQREKIFGVERKKTVEELSWLREDGTVSPKAETEVARLDKLIEEGLKVFEAKLEAFNGLGVELKDLNEGLVDFFASRGETLVYLCWKEGEDRVRFWHDIETGFSGRKSLEQF